MKQCMDADNLHRRLKKIIGQVQAIDRMVDEDVPCEDILAQINAAKSALHRAGQVVLEGHIKHCVRDGIEHGDADETIARFTKAVERFGQHELNVASSRILRLVFVFLLTAYTPMGIMNTYPHGYYTGVRRRTMEKLEEILEWGGTKKEITLLVISGLALLASIFDWLPVPVDPAWVAIILCGSHYFRGHHWPCDSF